jgi:hypothetical protein
MHTVYLSLEPLDRCSVEEHMRSSIGESICDLWPCQHLSTLEIQIGASVPVSGKYLRMQPMNLISRTEEIGAEAQHTLHCQFVEIAGLISEQLRSV